VAMWKIHATEIILLSLCVIGVSINGGKKEYIRKRVSSVKFAVVRVRGLPCEVERLPLV